jgi:hypothetical protein
MPAGVTASNGARLSRCRLVRPRSSPSGTWIGGRCRVSQAVRTESRPKADRRSGTSISGPPPNADQRRVSSRARRPGPRCRGPYGSRSRSRSKVEIERDGQGPFAPGREVSVVAGLELVEHRCASPLSVGARRRQDPAPSVVRRCVARTEANRAGGVRHQISHPIGRLAAAGEEVQRVGIVGVRIPDLDLVWASGAPTGRREVAEIITARDHRAPSIGRGIRCGRATAGQGPWSIRRDRTMTVLVRTTRSSERISSRVLSSSATPLHRTCTRASASPLTV